MDETFTLLAAAPVLAIAIWLVAASGEAGHTAGRTAVAAYEAAVAAETTGSDAAAVIAAATTPWGCETTTLIEYVDVGGNVVGGPTTGGTVTAVVTCTRTVGGVETSVTRMETVPVRVVRVAP